MSTTTIPRTPDLLDLLRHQPDYDWPALPDGHVWGWRSTRPDLRSRDGYRWPWPGGVAVAPADGRDLSPDTAPHEACPSRTLGGLCLARTWQGATSGGVAAAISLLVSHAETDVLGVTTDKLRVSRAVVHDVIDVTKLDLYGANLVGAGLYGANLRGANLRGANLVGAGLYGANLRGANLRGANLRGAGLYGADLVGANLRGAGLRWANLYGALRSQSDPPIDGWVVADGRLERAT